MKKYIKWYTPMICSTHPSAEEVMKRICEQDWEITMKKQTLIPALMISAIIIPLAVFGASAGIDAMNLNMAVKHWNYSNEKIVTLEAEIALERTLEVENFCFLVETKKDQDLAITPESLTRYESDCTGL